MSDTPVLLAEQDYPLLNLFWTMLLFFAWIIWFFLLFRVIADVFDSDDLSGWGKAGWTVEAIVVPFFGVFIYLIFRGKGMPERGRRHTSREREAMQPYIQ
ncbi:PLDc N-terminal domain-containing protein [Jatrophihabitans sp. DSM 45814]